MKKFLKGVKISSLILAVFAFAIGLAAALRPEAVTVGLCRLLGAAVLAAGIGFIVSYFTSDILPILKSIELVVGVIAAVAGIWILVRPEGIVKFIYVILGFMLIINGLTDIQAAAVMSILGRRKYLFYIVPVATIILGAVVLFNPFSAGSAVMRFAGISLIIGSISGFITIIKAASCIKKAAEKSDPLTIEADSVTMD